MTCNREGRKDNCPVIPFFLDSTQQRVSEASVNSKLALVIKTSWQNKEMDVS